MRTYILLLVGCLTLSSFAQNNTSYWQQKADYTMDIDFDVESHQYKGKQTIEYTNNSPDTLNRVFYHLYFNAFQPGSEMDVRSRTIADADPRVKDRISKLSPEEIGFIKPMKLTQNGMELNYDVVGTVMEVDLAQPILPGASTTFYMEWDAQVPVQIRRSGRYNAEGVAYSMTQWYPKLAEYDFQGWHAHPYIGREFHGVWGDWKVSLSIDKDFVVGGTGYLVGQPTTKRGKTTYVFDAPMVHDFTWAADPDYIHDTYQGANGVTLNFYYKKTMSEQNLKNWKELQPKTAELLEFFNTHIGTYPYKQYSVIQGGDGGMEYAMSTLITGERKFGSLVGVTAHEMAHSWFQFLLATNESIHEWMDEGFTSYISNEAMNEIMGENAENPHTGSYRGYIYLANSGKEQPLTTHADRYDINMAYGIAAYSKGAVFMAQLGYVIGKENLAKTIKRYYKDFVFKHPTPNDFIRVAEKVSGMELDWYLQDFGQTTNTIDYGIENVIASEGGTQVTLKRTGLMPMPIDLMVTYADGSQESFYIPLRMMRGGKDNPYAGVNRTVLSDWAWAYPTYDFEIPSNGKTIQSIEIDPSKLMADAKPDDNMKKM
ncbi:M1 family metallopeptidase [Gilvibacter sediminis]|uniref:M1 family metallopeptidase n=1 Tax=Gilvibacter sediminis TaxID=379071 RepID=UPI00234FE572|nr:M1 family metallopeptidase [Gilvibacter sediminis]MDC7996834.1 M1 family metallopeptidase [Gilvibacter sediminis]